MSATKYQTWVASEVALAAAAAGNLVLGADAADEDMTIVSAFVSLGVSGEASGVVGTAGNSVFSGCVALQVLRAGMSANQANVAQSQAFLDRTVADTMNDGDQGDFWAVETFTLTQQTSVLIHLAPRTARKLRKGDVLQVVLWAVNNGPDAGTLAATAASTFFVQV